MTEIITGCIERKWRTKRPTRVDMAPIAIPRPMLNRVYSRTATPQSSAGLFQPNRHHNGGGAVPSAARTGGRCQPSNLSRLISWALLCLCTIGLTVAARAQQTNAVAARAQASAFKQVTEAASTGLPQVSQKPPNQTKWGTFTTEGIAIQLAKTPNPLQLINPAATADYGSAEANVVRDPINRKVSGLKIFSLHF